MQTQQLTGRYTFSIFSSSSSILCMYVVIDCIINTRHATLLTLSSPLVSNGYTSKYPRPY